AMTQRWITEKAEATSDRAREGACPRCGATVIRARAGRVAALDVIADAEPITPVEEIVARLEGRLTWHLVVTPHTRARVTWRHGLHIQAGPAKHPVLRDHQCPNTTPGGSS
ncbi:hypothetical protein ACFU96_48205, partial [Streptomyces sp. NPDC057620]|uniref:hypothetical protein n=1 Tax=Streptomyces sp. NPDC057620 TaxID=3346185 RepID=UPI003679DB2C